MNISHNEKAKGLLYLQLIAILWLFVYYPRFHKNAYIGLLYIFSHAVKVNREARDTRSTCQS